MPAILDPSPRKIPGTHFCSRLSLRRAVVCMETLDELKNLIPSLGIKPISFKLAAVNICNELFSVFSLSICNAYINCLSWSFNGDTGFSQE
jgi:hypothetical protein